MSYEYNASIKSMAVGEIDDVARTMFGKLKDIRETSVSVTSHSLKLPIANTY